MRTQEHRRRRSTRRWILGWTSWLSIGVPILDLPIEAKPAIPVRQDGCGWFHQLLDPLPHEALTLDAGRHRSLYDGTIAAGCQIRFRTNDALLSGHPVPELTAIPDSELYRLGWRMEGSISADGPGSSLFALRRESELCLIYEAQPAYLDDAGEIQQGETLEITIQCREP